MSNENNNIDTYDEYSSYDFTNDIISVFTILDIIQRRNNLSNVYIDNLLFEDDLATAMRESLETDKQLVRTDEFLEFKTIKYCNIDDKNSYNTTCSICLTNFEDECDVSVIDCEHLFHTDCIKEWSRYKKNCPICREELKK